MFARIGRVKTSLASLFVIALTACGGGGGGGALPATPDAHVTPMPLTVISNSGGVLDMTGTITGMISGGFQLQGGQGVGYMHVYTNSSTVVTGPAPFVGENVEVVGTGTLSSGSITASSVKQLVASPSPSASPSPAASPSPIPVASATPVPTPAATSGPAIGLPVGVTSQKGQIVALLSGGKIQIQAGAGCGYMNVLTTASTTYLNGAPKVGLYGNFTGTGPKCSNSFTAVTVSLSAAAPASVSASGTVAAETSYGFTLNAGGTQVPVALTSSTAVFGGQLVVGANVTVTGTGSADSAGIIATQVAVAAATPTPAPVPTPTPGPISRTHVMLAGYVYGYSGTPATVPLSSISPWIDWAQTDATHASMLRSAGIKVDAYTNFWRNYTSDNPILGYTDLAPGGAHASAEAKDCSGNAVYDTAYGGGYEADARSSSALAHAQVVVNYRLNQFGSNYDALFADDSGAVTGITLPCGYTQAAYDQAVNAVHSALGVPMWINALGAAQDPSAAIDLAQPGNVLGAMCELCYSANGGSNGDYIHTGTYWQQIENAEIGMAAQHKIFWDYARATGDPSIETSLRTYVYASFLLGFDPAYSMFEEAFATPSGFPVMPEAGLVPLDPLTTANSVSGYQQPGGAYMREFGACYYRGAFVDRCAVVVNSSPSGTVPVPTTSYFHSMVLSGSGVLDGGSVSFAGPQVTQLSAGSAVILFP